MASATAQATREGARFTVLTVIESIASEAIEVGASTPVVAPLCTALLRAKDVVDAANQNKEDLEALHARCERITVQVIDKAEASKTSKIDVYPLQKCVVELKMVAEGYRRQRKATRMALFRKNGGDIQRLRTRIDATVRDMGLERVVDIGEKVAQILARIQSRHELALVPRGWERGEAWHVVRHEVEDNVYNILGGGEGPAMAALTGRSGAGKTTAAAAMVGERQGPIRPRAGETNDQACTRLDRFRALFSDGVIWLRVGKGAGAAERLPDLMHKLARALYEDVMKKLIRAPEVGEAGESYVKRIMGFTKKRCLVVADDVWEPPVVEKLRETGMWVLLTTRDALKVGVEPDERVHMDQLTRAEAEDVLRGSARLPPDERLCDAAADVLEICGFTAMDVAFVGRWESVCTTNGVPLSREAWACALREIMAQIGDTRGQAQVRDAGEIDDLDVNRLAVLRAGSQYIGTENALAGQLYPMLAVFPHGHAFGHSDAGVLLNQREEVVRGTMTILERWGVLRKDASEKYSMHDAHVDFARGMLDEREDLRDHAVHRWTSHISHLDNAVGIDLYTLLDMWHVLEFEMGGKGWFASRPYDDQLVRMDVLPRSKPYAVNFVAGLFDHDQKFDEMEALMQRVLKHCDDGDNREMQMTAIYHKMQSLFGQGRFQEYDEVKCRLCEMVGPSLKPHVHECDTGFAQTSTTFHIYGVCAEAAERLTDAEEWFRKALKVEKDGGRMASSQAVSTLHEMGRCVRKAGRLGEAEVLFKRALEIKEAKLGADHLNAAWTLDGIGQCVRLAGRLGEAEGWYRRALEIKQAKLGVADVAVAYTLNQMGRCAREAGRLEESEAFLKRALGIREVKLGAEHPGVALTLQDMGLCAREAGRRGEAEALFSRALEILQANPGPDDPQVAAVLHALGLCVREAGRTRDADVFFRRALEILQAKLGPDHVNVAKIRVELNRCAEEAGGPAKTE